MFPKKSARVDIATTHCQPPGPPAATSPSPPVQNLYNSAGQRCVFNKVSGRDEISTQCKIISFVKCVWFRSSAYKVFNSRAGATGKVRRGTPLINGQRKPKEMKQFECCVDMFLLRFIDTCYSKKNKLVTTLVINNNGHTSTTQTSIINSRFRCIATI